MAIMVESFGSTLPTRLVSLGAVDQPGEDSLSNRLNMAANIYILNLNIHVRQCNLVGP